MAKTFDEILDECVDRLNGGEGLEDCLASYPEHAAELEPLLRAVLDTQTAYTFTPSPAARLAARQRFNAAREKMQQKQAQRRPLFGRALGRSAAWVAVAAMLALALIGYFGIRPALFPGESTHPGPYPGPQGRLAFLMSDEQNAIGDFQSLNITISKIYLHLSGEDGGWIELEPQAQQVDLTKLPGVKAQQIWSGNVTAGNYTQVRIEVSEASGVLLDGNRTVEVKVPSDNLKISTPFSVGEDSMVWFVYDITVVKAGNSGNYNLQPQVGESGADKEFELIDGEG